MAEGWSRLEVEATVADYFEMWAKELRREPVNKARHNLALRSLLQDRSKSAVEFKHQNISAILIELGLPYIEGYKPAPNYQKLLRDVVVARIEATPALEAAARASVDEPAFDQPMSVEWGSVIVPPPERAAAAKSYRSIAQAQIRPIKVDYLEREARNQSLGLAGERFVLEVEHRRLWSAGRRDLAERVEHVALTADGLGYDIMSFEANGRERLVEVKTTRYGQMTPFYASRNEVSVSEERAEHFHLFRVFSFDSAPRAFVLPGSLRTSVSLEPVVFKGSLRD